MACRRSVFMVQADVLAAKLCAATGLKDLALNVEVHSSSRRHAHPDHSQFEAASHITLELAPPSALLGAKHPLRHICTHSCTISTAATAVHVQRPALGAPTATMLSARCCTMAVCASGPLAPLSWVTSPLSLRWGHKDSMPMAATG